MLLDVAVGQNCWFLIQYICLNDVFRTVQKGDVHYSPCHLAIQKTDFWTGAAKREKKMGNRNGTVFGSAVNKMRSCTPISRKLR